MAPKICNKKCDEFGCDVVERRIQDIDLKVFESEETLASTQYFQHNKSGVQLYLFDHFFFREFQDLTGRVVFIECVLVKGIQRT